jgi:hypothetical protein
VIPADASRLIQHCIRSIWDLEVLLLVQRGASRLWGIDDIVRELRGSQRVVTDALLALKAAGLVAEDSPGQYRYAPASLDIDEAARQLQQAYAAFPVAVAEAIYRAPNRQIRDFADAFRLKKD